MKTRTLLTAVALVVVLSSVQAFAWSRDFKFTNNTSQGVDHLSMKQANYSKWEVTRLSRTDPGSANDIRFDRSGPCTLDLRVSFVKPRNDAFFTDLNFCNLTNLILQENSDGSVYLDWNSNRSDGGGNESLDADHAR